jgi:hypothetical protein
MDDYFIIPVNVDGQELEFEGRLLLQGFIHRIEVIVDEVPVLFEPDEEGNYRALVAADQMEGKGKNLNRQVLQAITEVLENLKLGNHNGKRPACH